MAEFDFRLLERRIDVLEAKILPLEDQLKPRMRKEKRAELMRQIQALHSEQLGCIREITRLQRVARGETDEGPMVPPDRLTGTGEA